MSTVTVPTTAALLTSASSRRRFLASASLAMLGAHIGTSNSARAESLSVQTKESTMATIQLEANPATAIHPFRVEVPQAIHLVESHR